MSKGIYLGINGVARKVTAIYVGVSGVAHRVIKAYKGVGGVARLCYYIRTALAYFGTATPLQASSARNAAASVGNYAIFAGGGNAYVTAYNDELVKTDATSLNANTSYQIGVSIGVKALFTVGSSIRVYNSELTSSIIGAPNNKTYHAAVSTRSYAFIAGGTASKICYAVSKSLVATIVADLVSIKQLPGAVSNADYAIFAGGYTTTSSTNTVDIYNDSLTHSVGGNLDSKRNALCGGRVGNYMLIAGGNSLTSTVYCYSTTLVRTTISSLAEAAFGQASVTRNNEVMFFGYSPYVDIYDANLIHRTIRSPIASVRYFSGARAGDYALFSGGNTSLSTVYAFL